MVLSRAQKLGVFGGIALLVIVGVIVAIVLTKKKKKNAAGNTSTPSVRVLRIASRVPFDSYPDKTTGDAMTTMASAMQTRIQTQLGSNGTATVTPAGLEELQWLAKQQKKLTISPGLKFVSVVPTSAPTTCKSLDADKDWSAFIGDDYTVTVQQKAATYGAFIIEASGSSVSADDLNAAINKATNSPTSAKSASGDPPAVFITSADAFTAAPTNADALKACA